MSEESSKMNLKKGKRCKKTETKCSEDNPYSEDSAFYKGFLTTWKEDMLSGLGRLWTECDSCDGWLHVEFVSEPIDEEFQFICPDCFSNLRKIISFVNFNMNMNFEHLYIYSLYKLISVLIRCMV